MIIVIKALKALNVYAHLKTKMLRFNNSAFMTKKLRKEIMKRSKLKKITLWIEVMKFGVNIKPKETIAWIFPKNKKKTIFKQYKCYLRNW